MNLTAYFSQLGTPKTGLSPTVNIRDISDGSLVVTAGAMTEVGDGFYWYAFAGYDPAKDYTIRCDGGATLIDADRYAAASTGFPADGSGFTALGDARLANLDAAISTRTKPADTQARVTLVDTTTENTDMRGTDDAATEAKQDIIDTVVDAIKLKTDTLGGAGAITWTYTLTNSVTGAPIDGAEVWVSSDSAGAFIIANGTTDDDGVVTFYLDAGTVYVWRKKAGFNFTNPDEETVS